MDAFRADDRQTICIMVTADPNPHLALNWMKKGAAAYLRKPFGPEYLVELCHKAMRERALLNVETLLEQRTRKLRDSEAAFRAVTERMEMALQGADLGTWDWHIPDGTVVFNERWAVMLGFALNEITPKVTSRENRVHPDDLPTVMAELEAHLRGETPFYETEHRLQHKTGDWIWVLDKGRVFERDRNRNPIRACPAEKSPTGWGLLIIQEKAVAAGGRCRVFSRPGHDTRLQIEIGPSSQRCRQTGGF